MQFIPSVHTYDTDIPAKSVWETLQVYLGDADGYAYYRHPQLRTSTGAVPDLVMLARGFGALAVRIVREGKADIAAVELDPYNLDLDDFQVSLEFRFDQERRLRRKIPVNTILAFPHIMKADYEGTHPPFPADQFAIWKDPASTRLPQPNATVLTDLEWRLAKSVFQSASPLNASPTLSFGTTANTLGEAIKILHQEIALLDDQQSKVAIQIPPGPQRIRGLAGTGKTVLLAMKAANIHSHFPDKNVLFTFNTQSLYNQAKELITQFYRFSKQSDPDWTRLHVRHGWGGAAKPGVYSELCTRQGERPLTFSAAKQIDQREPFRACCRDALSRPIKPTYDYALVDEAQDFPKEFFQILYQLMGPQRCIYFAFDELQSLSSMEIPTSLDLFGVNAEGSPLVDLDGEYPGPMDKDLILFKAYRCPQKVLMLAHAIGLGIHSKQGCVQMISSLATWNSIGYEIVQGPLTTGTEVIIRRPLENSPNRAETIYTGAEPLISATKFANRDDEFASVANWIKEDIENENVRPEHILVISMDSLSAKKDMAQLQRLLLKHGIASIVPGLIDASDEFAESGNVTLSTVYRAKGNEAPVVYIICFDCLYDYIAEVDMRNRAFTCISRSKGWVRITGAGPKMEQALQEINHILADIPDMKFVFPDMTKLERNLDAAETTRRRREVRVARKSVRDLSELDEGALAEVDPAQLEALEEKIRKIKEARGDG